MFKWKKKTAMIYDTRRCDVNLERKSSAVQYLYLNEFIYISMYTIHHSTRCITVSLFIMISMCSQIFFQNNLKNTNYPVSNRCGCCYWTCYVKIIQTSTHDITRKPKWTYSRTLLFGNPDNLTLENSGPKTRNFSFY